jgi:hypothetical protein
VAVRVNASKNLFQDSLIIAVKKKCKSLEVLDVISFLLLSHIKELKYVHWQNTFQGMRTIPFVPKSYNLESEDSKMVTRGRKQKACFLK